MDDPMASWDRVVARIELIARLVDLIRRQATLDDPRGAEVARPLLESIEIQAELALTELRILAATCRPGPPAP